MSDYILATINDKKKISSLVLKDSYLINMRNDNGKVFLFDESLKGHYVKGKFIKMYVRFLKHTNEFFESDPDDDGFSDLISEFDRLENLLKTDFINHLKKKEYDLFLEDIYLVRDTLNEEYKKYKRKQFRR